MNNNFGAPKKHYQPYNQQYTPQTQFFTPQTQILVPQNKTTKIKKFNKPLVKSYFKISGLGLAALTTIGMIWQALLS